MTPRIMCSTGATPNSTLATLAISTSSWRSEKGGGACTSGVTSSAECAASTWSEWPLGGSLITNLIRPAMISPGTPTTMKATCQLNVCASQPPATAPIMPPRGMPKA